MSIDAEYLSELVTKKIRETFKEYKKRGKDDIYNDLDDILEAGRTAAMHEYYQHQRYQSESQQPEEGEQP